MPIDPAAPLAMTPEARTVERLADLERRLSELERGTVAPTSTAAPAGIGREGYLRGQDTGTGRLWLYVGGAWRFVALT